MQSPKVDWSAFDDEVTIKGKGSLWQLRGGAPLHSQALLLRNHRPRLDRLDLSRGNIYSHRDYHVERHDTAPYVWQVLM